jgi:poly(A) polymerase
MRDEGVLDHFLAQATAIDRLDRMVAIESGLRLCDPLRRLAALLPVDGDTARHLGQGLRLSNSERDRLVAMAAPEIVPSPGLDRATRRRGLYAVGREVWSDLVLSTWAAGHDKPDDRDWRALFNEAQDWERPKFPLSGQDVKKLGVEEGARIGELLRAAEEWWIGGDFQADRKVCLAWLAERLD